jgi:amidase
LAVAGFAVIMGRMVMAEILNRRQVLAGAAVLSAVPAAAQSARLPDDAIGLAQRIRSGDISAREAVLAALERAEAAQATLNYAILIDRPRAISALPKDERQAVIPTFIKDLNDYKGWPTRNGSRAFENAPAAATNEAFVEAFTSMNLAVLGKTATPEFGLMCVTEPLSHGATRNPWNPDFSPGGSSGGSAAAVAAGVVPIAHANDGGGSIRIPAALTGLFGFKPSRGRLAGQKKADDPGEIAVDHVLTRSVRDAALTMASLQSGEAEGLGAALPRLAGPIGERLRIGVVTATADGTVPDQEVMAGIARTRTLLTGLGHVVSDTKMPFNQADFGRDFLSFWSFSAAQAVGFVSKAMGPEGAARLEPLTLHLARQGSALTSADVQALMGRFMRYRAAYDAMFRDIDVLLTPVLTRHAVPIGTLSHSRPPADVVADMMRLVAYTPVQNAMGAAAMSVPIMQATNGLPLGMHFAGRRGDDARLLDLAFQLEAAAPWAQRLPPIWFGNRS